MPSRYSSFRAARAFLCSAVAVMFLAAPLRPLAATPAEAAPWVTTWGSSQEAPYQGENVPAGAFDGNTLRETVHVSVGGARLRLHLSNAFGGQPLVFTSVHVALRGTTPGSIDPVSDRVLHFNGSTALSIPMGAEYLSDPVDLLVAPLSAVVITLAGAHTPQTLTLHAGARATAFLAVGDHTADAQLTVSQKFTRWYFLAGVEVASSKQAAGSVVTLGDSITDGHGATTDANDRWPDVLARRLAADSRTRSIGVVNQGIGGNRILQDGLGPNALARFDRDVLAQPGVRYLIVLEGINDLGRLDRTEDHPQSAHDALLADIKGAMTQMVARAHAHGIKVYGATLTPDAGSGYYHPKALSEADRTALNQWIRTSGVFDAAIDFDAALRDPAQPDHLLPSNDSGDHLHPGPEGYKRMGEAIPLSLFNK